MPSLLGSALGGIGEVGYFDQNYQTSYQTNEVYGDNSNFGTRKLRFIAVTVGGTGAPDLTKQSGTTGFYYMSDSYYSVAVRSLQIDGEIYFVGTPSTTAFVAAVADTTFDDSAVGTNYTGTGTQYGQLESNIYNALVAMGVASTVTVTVTTLAANGATIA